MFPGGGVGAGIGVGSGVGVGTGCMHATAMSKAKRHEMGARREKNYHWLRHRISSKTGEDCVTRLQIMFKLGSGPLALIDTSSHIAFLNRIAVGAIG